MITDLDVFREDRLPRKLVHREGEVDQLSRALQPALQGEQPEDVLISGPSGVGKTALARYLLDNPRAQMGLDSAVIPALGERTGTILRRAINDHPSERTVHRGTPTSTLPEILRDVVEDPYVLVLDEADDLPETEVLDELASVPGVAVIAIAHEPNDWLARVESPYRSRFDGEHHITLDRYSPTELADLLEPRAEQGLEPGAVSREQLETVADLVAGVARNAIQTLKWSARLASDRDHDVVQEADIVDGRHEAQREIRASSLRSLPYHHQVLYELVRATQPVHSSDLHDRYEAVEQRAYEETSRTPIGRRARTLKLGKLREYDLVEWDEHDDNSRTYRVVDAEIHSEYDVPVTPLRN